MIHIYVAGPYRAETEEGVQRNIESATRAGVWLCNAGFVPDVPHLIPQSDRPNEWYLKATMERMLQCDAVLFIGAWEKSEGCLAERAEAEMQRMPCFYSQKELLAAYGYQYGDET
jgi:hypothetical protein